MAMVRVMMMSVDGVMALRIIAGWIRVIARERELFIPSFIAHNRVI